MVLRAAALIVSALGWVGFAAPVSAQGWAMVDTEGAGGAGAFVCAEPGSEGGTSACFRLTCENGAPLHYEISLFNPAEALAEEVAVELRVDDHASGLLLFTRGAASDEMTVLDAPYDPRLHGALIAELRKGNRAELEIQNPAGAIVAPISLSGSGKSLAAVMETCPIPEVPLNDPAAVVLDEIVRACGQLGGSVAMEPGFERHEDLDGDGRDDVVIDYAAAVCSEMASLYCGSGGCTVGFFLARDDGYERIFDGVIRGYSTQPGGLLALDLHGTACGLYGFEACRKVFRIDDESFALIDEISGTAAEAAQTKDGLRPAPETGVVDDTAAAEAEAATPEATAQAAPEAPQTEAEANTPPASVTDEPEATPNPAPAVETPAPAATSPAPTAPETEPQVTPEAVPEPTAPEAEDATDTPSAPAIPAEEAPAEDASSPETTPALPSDAPEEPAPTGLEWMGDGGSVFIPAEGESLPADLAPDAPELGAPAAE